MTEQATVAIVRATEYETATIEAAVAKSLKIIGGIDDLVRPGRKILLKINHLPPASAPEKGIITHPVFTEAVIRHLQGMGAEITVGDDIESARGFAISGYDEMCRRNGVQLINFREQGFTETPGDGRILKSIHLANFIREVDSIINLPKLKTHSLAVLTGGIKNNYGFIPSGRRVRWHGEYARPNDFNGVLVDIFAAVKPQLTIMDGIVAMEGEGPALGSLRQLGVILASRDTVALDTVAAAVIGLDPGTVGAIRQAAARGLGSGDLARIKTVGEKRAAVRCPDFKLPLNATSRLTGQAPRHLIRHLMGQYTIQPYLIIENCVHCGECQNICPAGAIHETDGRFEIDYRKCIRCLCCGEVCRYDAIVPRRPLGGRIMNAFYKAGQRLIRSRSTD